MKANEHAKFCRMRMMKKRTGLTIDNRDCYIESLVKVSRVVL